MQHTIHTQTNCLFVGLATLDHIWYSQILPEGDGKSSAQAYEQDVGGMATNAALAASCLGANVYLLTYLGGDVSASKIQHSLQQNQIKPMITLEVQAQTPVSSVVIDAAGNRMLVNFPGSLNRQALSDFTKQQIDQLPWKNLQVIEGDTRLCELTRYIFSYACSLNIPTVLDIEKTNFEHALPILAFTHYAIFSKGGWLQFSQQLLDNLSSLETSKNQTQLNKADLKAIYVGLNDLFQLIHQLPASQKSSTDMQKYLQTHLNLQFLQILKNYLQQICQPFYANTPTNLFTKEIIITLGEYGLLRLNLIDNYLSYRPAYAIQALNTNGAGDVFHGAFAYALSQMHSNSIIKTIDDVLTFASKAATLKCQTLGRFSQSAQDVRDANFSLK